MCQTLGQLSSAIYHNWLACNFILDEILTMKGPKGYPYRYPFSVKVEKKISAADLMGFNRDHLEGTYMDLTKGPLAGP